MLTYLLYAFIGLYAFGSYLGVRWLNSLFSKGIQIGLLDHKKEEYGPFARNDIKKWNKLEMYLCAIFLLPIRIMGCIAALAVCSILSKIVIAGQDTNNELSPMRRFILNRIMPLTARTILWWAGFLWVKRIRLNLSDYISDYPKNEQLKHKGERAPLIVANHVTWADIIHTGLDAPVSYVAKAAVKGYPMAGVIAQGLQSVFVDRDNKEARDGIMGLIENRVQNIKNGKQLPQLMIFPEGTTTNGQYIISFKKGAFATLAPVDIRCVKYTNPRFSPAIDIMGMGVAFLGTMCQLYNGVTMYEFDTFYPDYLNLKDGEEEWKTYADIVRNTMASVLKCKTSELGFRDGMIYEKELTEIIKSQRVKSQ
jgi:lysophosphatidylcholine acyltransferase/lyso-PAF acetyltransferase